MSVDSPGPHDLSRAKLRRAFAQSLGSVRHHRALFVLVCGATLAMVGGALAVMPRTYEVRCRIMDGAAPPEAARGEGWRDAPAQAAARMMLARSRLEALVRATDLVAASRTNRAPILDARDWLLARARGQPPSDEDLRNGVIAALERRLAVSISADGSVEIAVRWPDPVVAYRIVDAVRWDYVETWHDLQMSSLSARVALLEQHAADARSDVAHRVEAARRSAAFRPRLAQAGARAPPRAVTPLDADTRLRFEELERQGRRAPGASPREVPLDLARASLDAAATGYGSLLDRLESARLELDTTRAAFDQRYVVVLPPQVPRSPIAPTPPLVLLAGALDGLLLALAATTLAELRRGAARAAGAMGARR